MESFKGSVQLWDLGVLTNTPGSSSPSETPSPPPPSPSLPRLGVVIAHEYGCVRAVKWYRASSGDAVEREGGGGGGGGSDDSSTGGLLGLLSLACSDGCIRILS